MKMGNQPDGDIEMDMAMAVLAEVLVEAVTKLRSGTEAKAVARDASEALWLRTSAGAPSLGLALIIMLLLRSMLMQLAVLCKVSPTTPPEQLAQLLINRQLNWPERPWFAQ